MSKESVDLYISQLANGQIGLDTALHNILICSEHGGETYRLIEAIHGSNEWGTLIGIPDYEQRIESLEAEVDNLQREKEDVEEQLSDLRSEKEKIENRLQAANEALEEKESQIEDYIRHTDSFQ